jgi:peptidoglycan/LPS O-acetylase OafA/YrhL
MREHSISRTLSGPSARLSEVEGLRGVAAWSIVVFHVWVFSSPAVLGWNLGPLTAFVSPLQGGVTLFFVLSGFLLYRPIAAALLDERAPPPVLRYLFNRALRILPAYWAILVLTAFVLHSASLGSSGSRVSGGAIGMKTFLLDALLIHTYSPHAIWSGILPTWSLTVEITFYLALPILGAAALFYARGPARSRRRIIAALAPVLTLFGVGVIGKILVSVFSPGVHRATSGDLHAVLDRSFLTHADLFGFGMAAALIVLLWERDIGSSLRSVLAERGGRPLAYIGLPLIFLGFYLIPPYLYESLVAAFVAIVLVRILAIRDSTDAPGRTLLTHRWTLTAGRHSYSVFLWNYPLLAFLSMRGLLFEGEGAWAFLGNLGLATFAIAVLSALTYRFIEAPALRLKRRRRQALSTVPHVRPA